MIYRHTFRVVGSGPFPIDMLRYDACYPRSESEDSYAIYAANRLDAPPPIPAEAVQALTTFLGRFASRHPATEPRATPCAWVVTLVHDGERAWQPTAGRWASFLWYVVPGSHTTEKR